MKKFVVKGQKVVREDFTIEVEAKSYREALSCLRKQVSGEVEIESINDNIVTNETEAGFHDKVQIDKQIKQAAKGSNGEAYSLVKLALEKNQEVGAFILTFSGSGDDGRIDDIYTEETSLDNILQDVIGDVSINEILTNFAYPILDCIPLNWVDGEGGSGSLRIALKDSKIEVDISCCEYETTEGIFFQKKVEV